MLKKSMMIVFGAGVVMLIAAYVLAAPLADIFVGYDKELFEITRNALSIYACSFVVYGVNVFASSFFTALNNGGVSAAISFLRTLVFQTTAVLGHDHHTFFEHVFQLPVIPGAVVIADNGTRSNGIAQKSGCKYKLRVHDHSVSCHTIFSRIPD